MIDYEGRTETLSAFPETVPVSVQEYRELVEAAEKGRVMAEGILSAMKYDSLRVFNGGVCVSEDAVLAVFRAVYPEDYALWLDAEKKRVEEARKEAAGNDVL